jgi:hypothetical protein
MSVRSMALQFVAQAEIKGRSEPVGLWTPVQFEAHRHDWSSEGVADETGPLTEPLPVSLQPADRAFGLERIT